MADVINGIRVPFVPIVQPEDVPSKHVKGSGEFDDLFRRELEKLKFSNHAAKRLESRNIQLSEDEMVKLNSAIEVAESKGAKDSLVMMDDTAFIVNIPNRVVVTAVRVNEESEKVFTNIDSVVFA